MSTTTTAPARSAASWATRVLRLTRTEFTLFMRYKTAWMFLALPFILAFMGFQGPNDEVIPGYGRSDLTMIAAIGSIALVLGVGHPSNVFTARRESLVLKRLRVSGVPQTAIFGGVIGVIVLFTLLLTALITGLVFAFSGAVPRDPLMLVVAMVLSGLLYSLLGLLLTPLVRNAEAAQMVATVPIMLLLFLGGGLVPLDLLPEGARQLFSLLPSVTVTETVQAAYTGYDAFGGFTGSGEETYLGLWAAALPSIGVLLAWIALLALLVRRFFRWDPRQP